MKFSSQAKVTLIALAILVLTGFSCWVFQLMNGLGVTGMSNATSWGLYIAMFMFFVGLSAGGLIVASSAHVFHIEAFKKVAIPAVITSIVCICCAGLFILIDLGGLYRVWRLFTGPNPTSPLLWDVCVITTYLTINILDLIWLVRGDERKVNTLSYIALPVAILVHSVTAWIFGLQIAKAWYTAIMAPIFVASACDSGLALLIIGLLLLQKARLFVFEQDLMGKLSRLLATFIAVDGFFIGCECLTMGYPGAGESLALSEMAFGSMAPFFWFEIIGGLIIPFIILASPVRRQSKGAVALASGLVVCGVFCKRIWLLLTSFITPNVSGGPGITLGTTSAQTNPTAMWSVLGIYAPTGIEIAVVVGVISLGVIAFMVLSQNFVGKKEE